MGAANGSARSPVLMPAAPANGGFTERTIRIGKTLASALSRGATISGMTESDCARVASRLPGYGPS